MMGLPLSAAALRLRKPPGRPRTRPVPEPSPARPSGHDAGTAMPESRENRRAQRSALVPSAIAPLAPRLLGLESTATYLGLSSWKVRELEGAGILQRVRVPLPGDREIRKVLFDRQDLDRLISSWKEPA
jgi:hypothetical protein